MRNRTHATLALAASAMFAGSVLAQKQAAGQTGVQPAAQPSQQNQNGQSQAHMVDQEITQQLRQIAQDAKTAPDKLFILNAAIGNTFEIEYSQQARQKAENAQVKQLAERYVKDHEKMAQELKPVAQQLGVQLPQGLPSMKQEELNVLASLSGRQFDEQYVATMNAMHAHDVNCFEGVSALSQNAQLKQFATENLPTLQEHWQAVRQIAQSFGIMTQTGGANEATPAAGHLQGTGTGAATGGANTGANGQRTPTGTGTGGATK